LLHVAGLLVALDQKLIGLEDPGIDLRPFLRVLAMPPRLQLGGNGGRTIGTTPACRMRASVISCAIFEYVPDASTTANTWCPPCTAAIDGKAMHTLVMVPAMISCFFPAAFTAATKSGLSLALISPRRATYFACGELLRTTWQPPASCRHADECLMQRRVSP
jgi:hypothetical protein